MGPRTGSSSARAPLEVESCSRQLSFLAVGLAKAHQATGPSPMAADERRVDREGAGLLLGQNILYSLGDRKIGLAVAVM